MYVPSHLDSFQESVIREMTRKAIENDAINLSQGMHIFLPCKGMKSASVSPFLQCPSFIQL